MIKFTNKSRTNDRANENEKGKEKENHRSNPWRTSGYTILPIDDLVDIGFLDQYSNAADIRCAGSATYS